MGIQTIVDRLNPALLGLDFAQVEQISQDLADEIVAWAPGRLTGLIKRRVAALLSSETRNLPDSVIVDRIVAGKQGFDVLMQRIIAALKPIILREIQFYKSSQVVVKPAPQPKPVSSGGSTGIFGISGKNTVKFDSPANNYGYEF